MLYSLNALKVWTIAPTLYRTTANYHFLNMQMLSLKSTLHHASRPLPGLTSRVLFFLRKQIYSAKRRYSNSSSAGHTTGKIDMMNTKVTRDITVFTYENGRFFMMMTAFGLVQYFFWANLSYLCYSGIHLKKTEGLNEAHGGFWAKVIDAQDRYKNKLAVACVVLGCAVLFITGIYPLRTISKLILLKGGEVVQLTTYSYFGRTRTFTVPLKDISCTQSRLATGTQLSLKVRRRWFYFMLDKREGKFHNTDVFDYVVGLNRFSK